MDRRNYLVLLARELSQELVSSYIIQILRGKTIHTCLY